MKTVEIGINYIISWMDRQTPVWLLKGTPVFRPALEADLEFGDPSGLERNANLHLKGTPVSRPALGAELEFGDPSGLERNACLHLKGTPVYRPALEAELEFGDPSGLERNAGLQTGFKQKNKSRTGVRRSVNVNFSICSIIFVSSFVFCFSSFADEKLDAMLNKQYGDGKKDKPTDTVKPADTVKPPEKPAADKSAETTNDEKIDDMLKKLYGEDKKAKPAEIAKPADKPVDKKSESTVQNSIRDARSYIPSDIFKNAKESVVIVVTGLGWGSGFAVSPDGLVVTNKHVVADDNGKLLNCVVTHPNWNRAVKRCEIVKVSDTKDLALIRIIDYRLNDYPKFGRTDDKSLPVGSKVYALGHPGSSSDGAVGDVLTLTFTEGIVSGKDRVFLGNKCLQTTATINHGNSGGPLLDENCLVVGVNTFGLVKLENTFFAVTIEEVQNEFGKYLKK